MKMNKKIAVYGLSVATSAMLLASCSTIQNTNSTTKGAVIGTAAGAGLGALIGGKAGNTAVGAIAGAAIGGVAGGLIGKKMDRQAKEIENTVAGAEVIKADEGIIVKFDEGILFDFNSSTLKSAAKTNIAKLVETLNKEPGTEILVIGHTDNIGTLAANQKVSESRANAVKAYAVSQGLSSGRIKTEGKNYSEPIASNDTDAGRAENRRVEIVIVAGDQMIQEAQSEAGR
ncbi:outer membrane protein OmpA-like peptidoglycan-associated protein [Sphingobacterium allocomposti]|uniref:Outer membrane protein OmpA-like peptidoglycan-associated protein n=1 Tax=Sphingobacterium allocomposti TaxID=415956 RepID=A0A5S5DJE5_9SPHI|nr:OmpA family protein [Sphingobacterium composti Yoo et al. 2007 non Ten et al. 2007]TYP95805.1 outer membrane protein OmpA-like peptidoglycan-associated protein [Sphingobacterium composti Yoo et al. 2007 non Ten et al. 2007]HLS95127.1 OmpA family protein [Sphingobacterium sp.]